jgi:hypothetical protein
MTFDDKMERIYQRVCLVGGAGDRRRGQLCIMSFVALLAGERHTDAPCTASPVIRRFAMAINDEMPVELRQKLKPFAPRIIGTRDRRDMARVGLLLDAWRTEIVPRIRLDFGDNQHQLAGRWRDILSGRSPLREQANFEEIASIVARLLASYATSSGPVSSRQWYWLTAIDLLDRLCIIDPDIPRPAIDAVQVAYAEATLDDAIARRTSSHWTTATMERIRGLLPALLT